MISYKLWVVVILTEYFFFFLWFWTTGPCNVSGKRNPHLYFGDFGLAVVVGTPEPGQRLFRAHLPVLSDQKVRGFRDVQHAQHVQRHPYATSQVELGVRRDIADRVRVKDTGHDE